MKEQDFGVKWFNTVFYPQKRKGTATHYETLILPRLRKKEIMLFTPWGPRYNTGRCNCINGNDREIEALKFLSGILDEFSKNMSNKKFSWLFLGADLYGTRINKLPEDWVREYFYSLSEWLQRIIPMSDFKLWSEFDKSAEYMRYKIRLDFDKYIPRSILQRAELTAKAMGRGSDPKQYLIERVAEAMLIETKFSPIKVSCVARHKDAKVDCGLPCLYLLPDNLLAPWMG